MSKENIGWETFAALLDEYIAGDVGIASVHAAFVSAIAAAEERGREEVRNQLLNAFGSFIVLGAEELMNPDLLAQEVKEQYGEHRFEKGRAQMLQEAVEAVPEEWELIHATQSEVSYQAGFNECRAQILSALSKLSVEKRNEDN